MVWVTSIARYFVSLPIYVRPYGHLRLTNDLLPFRGPGQRNTCHGPRSLTLTHLAAMGVPVVCHLVAEID
jgi:hypothetical protein